MKSKDEMDTPLVSIIICSYNRKNDLFNCLTSLKDLDYHPIEIIVIDNGSTDGSKEMIEKLFQEVIFISNTENKGTDYSRNQGINLSKGEYIWFLDSDAIIIFPDCLKNMIELLKKNPDFGSVGGQVIKENNNSIYWIMCETEDIKLPLNPKNKKN